MTETKANVADKTNLATALAAFQANLPQVTKGNTARVNSPKGNYSYEYADLTDVSAAILPALAKHGLAWVTAPDTDDSGIIYLHWSLIHGPSEEAIRGRVPVGRTGDQWQTLGSAITYARRYCLVAATGVAPGGDDNDGKDARAGGTPEQKPRQAPPVRQEQGVLPAGLYDLGSVTTVEDAREMYRIAKQAGHLNLLVGVTQDDGTVGTVPFESWLVKLAATLADPEGDAAEEAERRAIAEHEAAMDAERREIEDGNR